MFPHTDKLEMIVLFERVQEEESKDEDKASTQKDEEDTTETEEKAEVQTTEVAAIAN